MAGDSHAPQYGENVAELREPGTATRPRVAHA